MSRTPRIVLAALVALLAACQDDSRRAGALHAHGQEAMACETYLANSEASRDRIVGSFLWVGLKKDAERVTPNQAGTLIATVPEMRVMVDQACTKGGPSYPLYEAAFVVHTFIAASEDPEIR